MMYVVLMKKFLLADSSELFIMYALFMKFLISLVGTSQWLLGSFRSSEPKNV